MSNQPFTFPPPPPPPPKRTTEPASREHNSFPNNRGSFRGAGSYRGAGRGGGRGGYGSNQNVPFYSSNRHQQPHSNKPFISNAPRNAGSHPSQKRDHQTAFNQSYQARPRPTAAPAVPSFNASIEHLLPRKPAPQPPPQNVEKPKKQNLLGLTPTTLDHDSGPEDDEDEEGRLASQTKVSHGLEIDYGGQQINLRTPADVAAWLAERRKRYPTQVKVEAAKKEAEEKKRKRQEEKAARVEAERQAREKAIEARKLQQLAKAQQKSQQQDRCVKKSEDSNTDMAAKARLKAEKLRLKALKAQERLAKAEEALRLTRETPGAAATSITQGQSSQAASPDQRGEQHVQPEAIHSTSDSELTDSDATSSSGSSTSDLDTEGESTSDGASDSDSAPEVLSTKRAALEHEISAPPPRAFSTSTPQICRAYARYGRCKFGSKCRHLHDTSKLPGSKRSKRSMPQRPDTPGSRSAMRKGLWQVMVEKEQEDERKKLLGAIITLGERGLLDEPSSAIDGHGRDGALRPVNTGKEFTSSCGTASSGVPKSL
ncbi:hypothetical protein LTS15_000841 [Exophiala xenobiotica]|nr:hypothetical protein LTS15_000841 [Exophiala xenobiotica]